MTAPAGALDYFALEAADCLARLRRWRDARAADPAAPHDDARRAARTLRGAANVAREPEFAALGGALEHLLGALSTYAAAAGPAFDAVLAGALDAAASALGASRPLPPSAVAGLRAATAAVDTLGAGGVGGAGDTAAALLDDANARVVPVRALARDGDAEYIVSRAAVPPARAGQRFRVASAPLARALRRLVAEARAADAGGAAQVTVLQTIGADLRAAVADVRELAESYDIAPAAEFFARREAGAAALEGRTLAAVDAAAAGLLLDAAPAAEVEGTRPLTEPGTDFRPATGDALVALLETGISGLGDIGEFADRDAQPVPALGPDEVVPVDTLLYRGRAAVERARAVRDELRARPGPPDAALLAELYELLDLAAAD